MKKAIGFEVKVTNRCNLKCFHCMNRDGWDVEGDLDADLFITKLKAWSHRQNDSEFRISELRLTGGERV